MSIHCVNIKLPEVQALAKKYSISPEGIAAKIALWQDRNGIDKWPTEGELGLSTIKQGVPELFESNSELDSIGTQQQYSQYLDTIFPDSKVKDIVYHGTTEFEGDSFKKDKLASQTGEGTASAGFHFSNKETATSFGIPSKLRTRKEIFTIPVLLNMQNKVNMDNMSELRGIYGRDDIASKVRNFIKEGKDSIHIKSYQGGPDYIVFEPEQIHILGSKQDIEGFKEFVSKKSKNQLSNNPLDTKYLQDKLGMSPHQISVVKELLNDGSFGALLNDGNILLSDLANNGVEYHEAFHRVFGMFLTNSERQGIIDEFKSNKDWQSKIASYKEDYPELSDNGLIEEYIADEFADFVLSGGKYTTTPQRLNFFQRVWRFFKGLFTEGNPNESVIQDLFEKINRGDFATANMVNPYISKIKNSRKIPGYSGDNTTLTMFLEGLNNRVLNTINVGNRFRVETFQDIDGFTKAFDIAFYESMEYIDDVYMSERTPESTKQLIDTLLPVLDNKELVKALYQEYLGELKIKLKFADSSILDVDDTKTLAEEESKEASTKDWAFMKPSIEADALDKASSNLKLLLASITKERNGVPVKNQIGLPVSVDFKATFSYLINKLGGLPYSTDILFQKIESLAIQKPELQQVINLLGGKDISGVGYGDNVLNLHEINIRNLRNEFTQVFTNYINTYWINKVNTDGSINVFDSGLQNDLERLVGSWESRYLSAVSTDADVEKFKSKLRTTIASKDTLGPRKYTNALLKAFGIEGLDVSYNSIIIPEIGYSLMDVVDNWAKQVIKALPSDIRSAYKKKSLKKGESEPSLWLDKDLKAIAKLHMFNNGANVSMLNVENKTVYAAILNTYLTTFSNYANFYGSKLKDEMPWLFDVWNQSSYILSQVQAGNKIKVDTVDGLTSDFTHDSDKTSGLSSTVYSSMVLNDALQGIYHFPQAGSREVVNVVSLEDKNGKKQSMINYNELTDGSIVDRFANYIADEIQTMVVSGKTELPKNFKKKNGKTEITDSVWFEFLKEKEISAAKSFAGNREALVNHIKEAHSQAIVDELQKYVADEIAYYNSIGIGMPYEGKLTGITNGVTMYSDVPNEKLLEYAIINDLVFKFESFKVWFGHPEGFKGASNIFKRLSSFNSSKKVSIESNENRDFLLHREALDLYYKTGEAYKAPLNKTFREVVFNAGKQVIAEDFLDSIINNYRNIYQDRGVSPEIIAKKLDIIREIHSEFEESDGLSFVNIYAYRRMKWLAGAWSDAHEATFRKVINNQELSPEEVVFFMEKPLYVGEVFKDSMSSYLELPIDQRVRNLAIRKTAYMPLIPQVIAGTNLEILHDKMIAEGIDTAHMTSATKLGDINSNELYIDGVINSGKWSTNELLWQNMGIQQDAGTKLKDHTSEATQSAKIQTINIYDNGVAKNKEVGELADTHIALSNKLVLQDKAKLDRELGVVRNKLGEVQSVSNIDKLKEIASEELTRNAADNTIESLNRLFSNNKLGKIDGIQSGQKIEQILLSIVQNRVIRRRREGTMLPQTSVMGFESGKRKLQGNKLLASSRLKYYRVTYNDNGTIKNVLPAQAIVPLPQSLVGYVNNRYSELSTFDERLKEFNKDLKSRELPIITIKGLRIPNQNYASNDVFQIAEFSHPMFGAVIIPSELVIKVGSDFDIDKMVMYYPHFDTSQDKLVAVPFYNTKTTKEDEREKRYAQYIEGTIENEVLKAKRAESRSLLKEKTKSWNTKVKEELSLIIGAIRGFESKGVTRQETEELINSYEGYGLNNRDKILHLRGVIEDKLKALADVSSVSPVHNFYSAILYEIKQSLAEIDDTMTKLEAEIYSPVLDRSDYERIASENDLMSYKQFISLKNPIDQNSTKALENYLLSNERKLLLHPSNYEQLFGAVSNVELKNIAEDTRKASNIEDENKLTYKQVMSGSTNAKKFGELFSALLGVGQTATHITSGALFQKAGVTINSNPFNRMWLVNEELSNDFRVGHIFDVHGMMISEQLSNILTAFVDAEKDNYSVYLGLKTEVNNLAMYLLRRRVPMEVISKFLMQPIIRDYLKAVVRNDAFKTFGVEKYTFSKEKLVELILKKYSGTEDTLKEMYFSPYGKYNLSNAESFEYLTEEQLTKNLTSPDSRTQIQVLDNFLMYTDQANKFQDGVRATQPDTSSDKDLNSITKWHKLLKDITRGYSYQVEGEEKPIRAPFYNNIMSVFAEGNYQHAFYQARNLKYDYFKNITITENPAIKAKLDEFKDSLTQYMSDERKSTIMSAINGDFLLFALSFTDKLDYSKFDSLLKGGNSVAKRVADIKADTNHPLYNNKAIQALFPLIDNKGVDSLKLATQKLTAREINDLTEQFGKIELEDKQLFDDLVLLNLYQAGLRNSPYQYLKIIPEEAIYNLIGIHVEDLDTPHTMSKLASKMQDFMIMFLRNNTQLAPRKGNTSIYKVWDKENKRFDLMVSGKRYSAIGNTMYKNYSMNNIVVNSTPAVEEKEVSNLEVLTEKPTIKATPEQQVAIDKAIDFINNGNSNEFFVIEGKAGTGKTTIAESIVKNFPNKSIFVAALSHKAKSVIRSKFISGGVRASFHSLASLLGQKLDMETGVFNRKENDYTPIPIENADIVLIDEASMINEQALELMFKHKPRNAKIVFLGDIGQLPPIRTLSNPYYTNKRELLGLKSPVFTFDKSYDWWIKHYPMHKISNKAKLLTRIRQGEESPILPFADNFWENSQKQNPTDNPAKDRTNQITTKGALVFSNTFADVRDSTLESFKSAVDNNNPNHIKVVTYKNATRININKFVHNSIFGSNSPQFNKGELVIFNNNYGEIENATETQILSSSAPLVDDNGLKYITITANIPIHYESEIQTIPVILEESRTKWNELVSAQFTYAFSKKGTPAYKVELKKAWALKEKFADVDYGYAITSHKSQGSTYDIVIVDEKDIMSVSPITAKEKSESIYTALTRAKNVTVVISAIKTEDIDINTEKLNSFVNQNTDYLIESPTKSTVTIQKEQNDVIFAKSSDNISELSKEGASMVTGENLSDLFHSLIGSQEELDEMQRMINEGEAPIVCNTKIK